ncbi:BTB domain-containing protein, partial [Oryctes borbonicus]
LYINFSDYTRIPKSESIPKIKTITSPSMLSPVLPNPILKDTRSTPDPEADEVCLRWNSHHSNMKSTFPSLLHREQYVDVTLTSEGKSLKCHRLILSACSSYFDELLSGISPLQHPVIFLNGVSFWVLKCLVDFMYAGEVHIEQNKLENLLKVAEMLQIKGLTGNNSQGSQDENTKSMSPASSAISIKAEKHTPEPKSTVIKRDPQPSPTTTVATMKSPVKKILSPTLVSAIDPLSLLEPTFFEENPVPLKFKEHVAKKVVTKKIKKRKSSEHEPSPPPMLYRKGTKSRPHVKIPRYYHNDFEGLEGKKLTKKEEMINTDVPELSNIKIESLIIETTNLQPNVDRRRSKELYTEKTKSKKQILESKSEIQDEAIGSADNKEVDLDPLAKEIKQEQIDVDYTDLTSGDERSSKI